MRLGVISQVHQRLRETKDDLSVVDMAAYLEDLANGLGDLLRDIRPIALRVESDSVQLATNQAVSIGLIVNELVTNAFKYAFPDGAGGIIEIGLRGDESGVTIIVEDNGIGCPSEIGEGVGSRLIKLMAAQYDGRFTRAPTAVGCRNEVTLRFAARSD